MNYNLGRVLPIFKGTYDASAAYRNLDVVYWDGGSYVAKGDTQGNTPDNTEYWQPVAMPGMLSPSQIAEIQEQVIEYVQAQGYVIDANYVHTDNNFTNADKSKLDSIDMSTKQDTLVSGQNIATINHRSLLEGGNIQIDPGSGGTSDYTQLSNLPSINGTTLTGNVNLATPEQLNTKQDTLVSGTNIATINNQSLLNGGNINIDGGEEWEELFPLWNQNHIGSDTGVIIKPTTASNSYIMWVQPVEKGDVLRMRVEYTKDVQNSMFRYDFREDFPVIGNVVTPMTQQSIASQDAHPTIVNFTAPNDGFFMFSCGGANYSNNTLDWKINLYRLVKDKEDNTQTVKTGERKLHFVNAVESADITESVSDIDTLYDDLKDAHPECFVKLDDIMGMDADGNEVRLYRLGYKNMGGLYTGYMFENSSYNGYYSDPNDGDKNHDIKHLLFDAGIHGDEKTAVYGLYLFCKAVAEGTDEWANYVKSNFIIDIIPIACTKSYTANTRLFPGASGPFETYTNPNRNFGCRSIAPVDAICAYIDEHYKEYQLVVDCHNQANSNAGGKCFVSSLRNGLYFEEILEFQKKYAGTCKLGWDGLSTWTKPTSGTPAVSDPKIVMQTNTQTIIGVNKYTMALPAYTRTLGIPSLTLEAPRRLNNTASNISTCNKNAAKLTADILCELVNLV